MRSVLTGKTAKQGDFGGFLVFSKCSYSLLEKKNNLTDFIFSGIRQIFRSCDLAIWAIILRNSRQFQKNRFFFENIDFWQFVRFLSRFVKVYQNSVQYLIFHFASISLWVFWDYFSHYLMPQKNLKYLLKVSNRSQWRPFVASSNG